MKEKVKIRELKSKVKIVRELRRGEEIDKLAREEKSVRAPADFEMGRIGASKVRVSPVLQNTEAGNEVTGRVTSPVRQNLRAGNEISGAQLYNVGRGMGNEREGERRNYRQVQQGQAAQRVVSAGGGAAAIPTGRSFLPSQQGLQRVNPLENEGAIQERNYDAGGAKKKERRAGPWE